MVCVEGEGPSLVKGRQRSPGAEVPGVFRNTGVFQAPRSLLGTQPQEHATTWAAEP